MSFFGLSKEKQEDGKEDPFPTEKTDLEQSAANTGELEEVGDNKPTDKEFAAPLTRRVQSLPAHRPPTTPNRRPPQKRLDVPIPITTSVSDLSAATEMTDMNLVSPPRFRRGQRSDVEPVIEEEDEPQEPTFWGNMFNAPPAPTPKTEKQPVSPPRSIQVPITPDRHIVATASSFGDRSDPYAPTDTSSLQEAPSATDHSTRLASASTAGQSAGHDPSPAPLVRSASGKGTRSITLWTAKATDSSPVPVAKSAGANSPAKTSVSSPSGQATTSNADHLRIAPAPLVKRVSSGRSTGKLAPSPSAASAMSLKRAANSVEDVPKSSTNPKPSVPGPFASGQAEARQESVGTSLRQLAPSSNSAPETLAKKDGLEKFWGWVVPKPRSESPPVSNQEPTTNYQAHNGDEILSKVPGLEGFWGWFSRQKASDKIESTDSKKEALLDSDPKDSLVKEDNTGKEDDLNNAMTSMFLYLGIFLVMFAGLLYGASMHFNLGFFRGLENLFDRTDWDKELKVAFLGNAYFYVNDVPRLMEAMSTGHIQQDSCIHPGGSLSALLETGNGMYKAWKTDEAVLGTYFADYGGSNTMYDYGACTVAQVLQGYDEYVGYGNPYQTYYDDGLNPCIMDEYYGSYITDMYNETKPRWDYVILADQTKRMAISEARQDTLDALTYQLGPLLNTSGAIPVLVDTHAFWSSGSNMTGLHNVTHFTAMIYEGLDEYVETLAAILPQKQRPLVAPVGLAYLSVYEESQSMWEALFLDDGVHASIYGSYLFGVVLYATLFGHLPDREATVLDGVQNLFADARKLMGQNLYYPSVEDADYLRGIAQRVVLRGFVPKALRDMTD